MKTGYDQFFKQAKKNAQPNAEPNSAVSVNKLRENIQQKKTKKPVRKFPLPQFVIFILCCVGLFFAIENFDQVETTLNKVEVGMGMAQAETPVATPPAVPATETTVAASTTTLLPKADIESDDSDYIYKLTERKKALDLREEELSKKAAEIEAQKVLVEKKLTELEEYRIKISTMLQDRIKADDAKVETLVQVYTSMKPSQAAKIFETMDEDLVIDILSRMKKKSAAEILNLIKTEKAQAFAERYAGYRLPASIPKPKQKEESD